MKLFQAEVTFDLGESKIDTVKETVLSKVYSQGEMCYASVIL